MRSAKYLANVPAGVPVLSDDIIEFHASRLLLIIDTCGTTERTSRTTKLRGLTKLAKLDFFVRYPEFMARAAAYLGKRFESATKFTESLMIRFHYGPWDSRYYQVLPYLEARDLMKIAKKGNQYEFHLTETGKQLANTLASRREFESLLENMRQINSILGRLSGNQLKNLVYRLFNEEVKEKKLGEPIK